MAARLLLSTESDQEVPVPDLADDLESFVHILTWVALRYTPFNDSAQDPGELGELG